MNSIKDIILWALIVAYSPVVLAGVVFQFGYAAFKIGREIAGRIANKL